MGWQLAALGMGNWASSGHTEDSLRPRASLSGVWTGKDFCTRGSRGCFLEKNSWRPWRTKACCRGKFRAGGWGLGFHFLVPAFWSLRLGRVKLASVHAHFLPDLGYPEQRSEGLPVLKMEGTGWGKRERWGKTGFRKMLPILLQPS